MDVRYQARFNDTGEPIGLGQPKVGLAVQLIRREGFNPLRCSVEKWAKGSEGWSKIQSHPAAQAVILFASN